MDQEDDKSVHPDLESPDSSSESHNGHAQKLLPPPEVAPEQKLLPPPGTAPVETKRPRWRRWFWVAAAVLAVLAFLLIYYFRSTAEKENAAAKAKQQTAAAAITVGQSKTGNINIYVDALGTVTPVYTVTLYSQITGQVIDVHYTEGQMVKKGDPLIDIDPRPYETTLTQAEGTLQHDQGVLAEARMDLQRYQAAFERNAIARQQLEDQAQTVVQDEGTVKADQGAVDYDKVQLSYCHIVSPITGRVGLRLVDPGNTVFAGSSSTLVVITQLQPITIVFNVSEDDLSQVQAQLHGGRTLEVDAFDRANEKQIEAGKLTSLDNEVDTTTGTVKFRATFPNKNLAFYPNQFVNARLLVKTLRKVTLVPSAAVQHNGTQAFVYVVNAKNTVAVQQVTALANDDQNTAVQGLNSGVNVATSGFDRLENGVEVTVRGQPSQQNNQGHGSNSGTGGTTTSKSNKAP
jgi:membrane fusion protein, multidrug efflux system